MIINVDPSLALPVYEQIREQVRRMVIAGTLEIGTRLPTIRQLANDLGLAKGTVAKAYALLERDAVVESRGHKGTFVIPIAATALTEPDRLADHAVSYATSARQLGASLEQAIDQLRREWIDP